jgi:hypothetical protein
MKQTKAKELISTNTKCNDYSNPQREITKIFNIVLILLQARTQHEGNKALHISLLLFCCLKDAKCLNY